MVMPRRTPLHRYHTYGLLISSAYRLAWSQNPSELKAARPDLFLAPGKKAIFARALRELGKTPRPIPWFQYKRLADGSDYLRWPRLFEFLLSPDGRFIYGHQLRRLSLETLQTYLMGQLLSFVLLKRGIESLHATAVALDNEAVGFLGDCGYGKSTLAAACVREGFSLLTDDLLRLDMRKSPPAAYPGPPRIKLMPAAAKHLVEPSIRRVPINPLTAKQSIPLGEQQNTRRKISLRTLYVLTPPRQRPSQRIAIRRLSATGIWQALTANTFNISVRDSKRLRSHFFWVGELSKRLTVKSLSYPRSFARLPDVVAAIRRDLVSDANGLFN